MSKCTLTLKIKDTTIVHTMPRKEALRLAIQAAQASEPSTRDDGIYVEEGRLTVIAFDVHHDWIGMDDPLEFTLKWQLCCASGSRFGELEALGYDWKAARDARIAAGGAW